LVKLSIIIPTYNEAENIRILIPKIFSVLNDRDFEVIIVDDNSPDKTWEVAEELAKEYNGIKIVRRPGKLGLASAVVDGLKHADGDIIAVMDADLQHPPELLDTLLNTILQSNADVVIASRYIEGGSVEGWSFWRRLVSKGATFIAHIILAETRGIKDPMSGFFMFRREVVENVEFNPKGFKILLEILVKGNANKVVEVPYTFRVRQHGKSKLGIKEYINFLRYALKLSGYKFVKFALVGISGIAVNMGLLALLVTFGLDVAIAGGIAIELSILNNFTWNTLYTFRDRRTDGVIKSYVKYHLAVLLGAVINWIVLVTLTRLGVFYMLANFIGILLGFIANYTLSELYVWMKKVRK